ncbi:esterase/lipase family protein [Streptomyces sp. NPDC006706]|uniref:esterase/lipase family protein n=1 Tax=Streptomyces sp. NPDC006706 TaxID=3364761 RepID=UPI0036AF22DD
MAAPVPPPAARRVLSQCNSRSVPTAHRTNGQYPFISSLRARGRTLVLVGFDDRSDSILRNAETVTAAILRTLAEQLGDTLLLVGGFSMGGVITRYALAKTELQRMDHHTGVYLSFDSPHRGEWVPIGLQAFAHHLAEVDDTHLRQISSPAAQQTLWRYLASVGGTPQESPLRAEFNEQLRRVGGWPRIPRLLDVSSGRGDGVGNGTQAREKTLSCSGPLFDGTYFLAQQQGDPAEAAVLNGALGGPHTITTRGFPEFDGAPGGTLESFGILGDALAKTGENIDMSHRAVCFVPSVSAVAVRDLDRQEDLCANIDDLPPDESELDGFLLSADNGPHAAMTAEIGEWSSTGSPTDRTAASAPARPVGRHETTVGAARPGWDGPHRPRCVGGRRAGPTAPR